MNISVLLSKNKQIENLLLNTYLEKNPSFDHVNQVALSGVKVNYFHQTI